MSNIQVFDFKQNQIRIVFRNNDPWFVAKDVCDVLGTRVKDVPAIIDEEERGVDSIDTLGGKQNMLIISEAGFYELVLKSRKTEAVTFRKWVTKEVLPSIRKTGSYGTSKPEKFIPFHLRRQIEHAKSVPVGYFSMLSEMCAVFIAPLETEGAPTEAMDKILPDISLGKMFCSFLREQGVDPDSLLTYPHKLPNGKVVQAKLYPEDLIGKFRRFVREKWIPEKSQGYLKEKAPELLPFLPKLLNP